MFQIYLQWMTAVPGRFQAGVSLHSHTLHSRENLEFIYRAVAKIPLFAAALRRGELHYRKVHGKALDLTRGWWTPPLGAHDAWSVEKAQIEGLGLSPMVSITDHDDIEAPVSLQLLEECRGTPISLEWTAPFRSTFFHIGVHNLPPMSARPMFRELERYTQQPNERRLRELMAALHALAGTLIVFNHPFWDEKGIGQTAHQQAFREFMQLCGSQIHALELNGLRPWRENRKIVTFAQEFGKPVISGGDRHALEPNALINLTNAASFEEFVGEVRAGRSEILIRSHYRESHASRILHNTIDVLKAYKRHANGWRLWSDRVFYRCDDDQIRSLTQLIGNRPPFAIGVFGTAMQLLSAPPVRRLLRGPFLSAEEGLA